MLPFAVPTTRPTINSRDWLGSQEDIEVEHYQTWWVIHQGSRRCCWTARRMWRQAGWRSQSSAREVPRPVAHLILVATSVRTLGRLYRTKNIVRIHRNSLCRNWNHRAAFSSKVVMFISESEPMTARFVASFLFLNKKVGARTRLGICNLYFTSEHKGTNNCTYHGQVSVPGFYFQLQKVKLATWHKTGTLKSVIHLST